MEGSTRVPYIPWLDFGGRRTRTLRSGRAVTDRVGRKRVGASGRYIYVTLGRRRDEITERLEDAIIEAAKRVGLEVV